MDQDKPGRCGLAMDPDSVLAKVKRLVTTTGIGVRLPAGMFKTFRLPVKIADRYTAGDYHVEARAFDPEIRVTPRYLRFAFRAVLKVSTPASAGVASR
jgi:hypothetical protein